MHLTPNLIDEFRERGYLLFQGLLDAEEVSVLHAELPALFARTGPEVVREKDGRTPRLVYGAHETSGPFGKLSRLPRILGPVKQLIGGEAYIHQSRFNPKQGFSGGTWNWHQDFGTWHREDGIPAPNCIMTAIFLDDATAVNSPLLVVPGSQSLGMLEDVKAEEDANGYTVMQIDGGRIEALARENGIDALIGPAGTVAFIHCNLVHGSANNVSPYSRGIMYLNYNAVTNLPTGGNDRAWYHNNPDRTPLTLENEDALHALARDKGIDAPESEPA